MIKFVNNHVQVAKIGGLTNNANPSGHFLFQGEKIKRIGRKWNFPMREITTPHVR